jgi:hypothetical protein
MGVKLRLSASLIYGNRRRDSGACARPAGNPEAWSISSPAFPEIDAVPMLNEYRRSWHYLPPHDLRYLHVHRHGDLTGKVPHLGQQRLWRLAQVQCVADDHDVRASDVVADWGLVSCRVDEVAYPQAQHGAVGEELVEVGVGLG